MMAIAGLALFGIVLVHSAYLVLLMAPLTMIAFSWNFVQANATALALGDYARIAGTAVALIGITQFVVSSAVAPLVGIAGQETAMPMALVILVCGLLAALALRALVPSVHVMNLAAISAEAESALISP